MSLLEVTKATLFKEVIECENVVKCSNPKYPNDLNKLLIVDDANLQFIKELIRPSELTERGFITTQNIDVVLQPMPIHLVYLIDPSDNNIKRIIKEFSNSSCPFLSAHIFAAKRISDVSMGLIKKCSSLVAKLASLKELPFSFVVETCNIFTLGSNLTIPDVYAPSKLCGEDIATRIYNMMMVTNDWPAVRHMAGSDLAETVSVKLETMMRNYGSRNSNFGIDCGSKKTCQILILDRNFDPKTPFIHDLTVEPMARDLLEVKDNVVEFNAGSKDSLRIHLNDHDSIWQGIRYMHLADAMGEISSKVKELSNMHNIAVPEGKMSINLIRKIMTRYPKFSASFKKYQGLTLLAQSCMDGFQSNNVDELVKLEQDFATNSTEKGDPVPDNPAVYVNLLEDIKSLDDRFRLIALYALKSGKGVPSYVFDKLVEIANIDFAKKSLSALERLNFPIIEDPNKKRPNVLPPPPEDASVTGGYTVSRFIPLIWSILKHMAEQTLDEIRFPFVGEKNKIYTNQGSAESANFGFGKYNKKKTDIIKTSKPRFYIFVLGGVCYSELRLLNIFEKTYPHFDACVGGTELLTPKMFVNYLKNM